MAIPFLISQSNTLDVMAFLTYGALHFASPIVGYAQVESVV